MTQFSKESIHAVLLREDTVGMHAIGRALMVLYTNQTVYERQVQNTINNNNMGFTPNDAKRGTSMADFYNRNGYLTQAQIDYWQKPAWTEKKKVRILKYWRQLIIAAEHKAAQRQEDLTQEMEIAA